MPVNFLLVFFSVILLDAQLCLLLCPLYWEFPRPIPDQWSTRRTHRSQHTFVFVVKTYYTRRRQSKSARVNGTWAESRGGQVWTSESPLPGWVTQDALTSSSNELWQHMGNTVDPGSSVETQCPGFLLGAGHIGILSYHIPKFQMPRRKADVQPEPPCSHK